ncbi:TIGR00159 family protein [Antarcticibacterium flavum]|uniref:Diadenylate cyclase n=1 Tax=Antarcticibacterium flavum TaxID=2058175 RepID=A0A5B7X2B0_9FLAO|nr:MULTISPECIES: diadenylate cyclase CdaA [Antarcticibacterium]MCM4159850.1 TIGR00159 family protein [Antarcticibacterium sp. W02-3]QCY68852.1 TIGR00159 family protein [Antarcticibacterium flavum]
MDFLNLRILDIVDIVFVAILLFYLYKLVKGTVAVNIFVGIVIVYLIGKLTQLLGMELLSSVLGEFIGVGMFALIVVFQQEIRKFLLMIGSTNFTQRRKFFRQLKFVKDDSQVTTNVNAIVKACETMGRNFTGALIIIQKSTKLDFVKNSGDEMNIELNQPIIESIFHKSGPLHDGAMIVEDNKITATRVILPVSNDRSIPLRFGLRHRAAVGITEKTDALAVVVSEETGQISYLKDGEFVMFENTDELVAKLKDDLT